MSNLITADLHLSENPRDAYRLQFFDRLPKLAQQYQCDTVIILGDLTEQKDRHGSWLVNRIVDGLVNLSSVVQVDILCGNHDYLDRENPFFRFTRNMKNIDFIDKQTRIGHHLYLPHTRNYKQDWDGLMRDVNSDNGVRLILTHNTFSGARGANNRPLEGIPLTALPQMDIISGDVHVPQQIENLIYVGSPYSIDFGDDYEPRVLIDDGENEFESVKVGGPRKRVIKVALLKMLGNAKVNKGDIVRVELKVQPGQYSKWAETVAAVRSWGEQVEVMVDSVIPIVAGASQPTTRQYRAAVSDEQLLKEYANQNKIDDRTLDVGLDLLK